MVGAVLVKSKRIIGQGYHHRAGEPHAEVEALRDVAARGEDPRGAALYVTLEPCCTHGRTPPCTEAIIAAGIARVVVGATDPNPRHCGRAFDQLRRAGVTVSSGVLGPECERLNEAFNHWIVHRTPWVTVKAAMTLDGKIATAKGESKWITGERARAYGMKLRLAADAILVGVNTVLADDPSLTLRGVRAPRAGGGAKRPRRIILDSRARTPLAAKVISDEQADLTTVVVSESAPSDQIAHLAKRVQVVVAPAAPSKVARAAAVSSPASGAGLDLGWVINWLGAQNVTHLLVEGGGEVNASFLFQRLAHRVAFFYAPKILGGADSRRGVAGEGAASLEEVLDLQDLRWRRLGEDWLLLARVGYSGQLKGA
jgi:diaminohydroxyphosphoribosylaminopyrimidine deaminase/5-amino-6-(5-phosphoribosylamino)uracil reductase